MANAKAHQALHAALDQRIPQEKHPKDHLTEGHIDKDQSAFEASQRHKEQEQKKESDYLNKEIAPEEKEHHTLEQIPVKNLANTAQLAPIARVAKAINSTRLRLRQAGDLHNVWDASIERNHTIADLMYPDYWKHVAVNLRPHDEIIAIEETGLYRAHLFIVGSDRMWAKVYRLSHHDLTESREGMPKTQEEEYDLTWTAIGKFAVIRKGYEGMPPLKDGFTTRLEAYAWLDGHLKTINA